ncbi:MAG: hypothetical protein M3P27_07200 [Acidobacteriota bacterium]|nr:hypothetical protein [Acidobacteriota bacterium]
MSDGLFSVTHQIKTAEDAEEDQITTGGGEDRRKSKDKEGMQNKEEGKQNKKEGKKNKNKKERVSEENKKRRCSLPSSPPPVFI